MNTRERIIGSDLFCGAGGFSVGLKWACEDLGYDLVWAAVNHWKPAIRTHERNHPEAKQYHSKIEQLHPPHVVEELVEEQAGIDPDEIDGDVDILLAGPECTHFSNARGGKPVTEQKRMSPWQVLDWLEKLNVDVFLLENVKEIMTWGPVDDGEPSRNGEVFDAWVNALNKLGYSVEWQILNAADYGDPTSRERFFIVGSQTGKASFPEPTHSKNGEVPGTEPWRTAAEIIDWTDLGGSIWTRDLKNPRVTPPKNSTMQRIAEGIRRHCSDHLEPFADVLEDLGRDEIRALRERVIPERYAHAAVRWAFDEPFLVELSDDTAVLTAPYLLGQQSHRPWDVSDRPCPTITTTSRGIGLFQPNVSIIKYKKNSPCQRPTEPLDTIHADGNHYSLGVADTILLRQQDGAHPTSVEERPVPTIATSGGHAIATTDLRPLVMPKNYPQRGLHSNSLYKPEDQPHHTVTADPRSKVVTPSLIRYSHGGRSLSVKDPMPTIATERGGVFALSSPYLCPLYNGREDQRPRTRSVDRPCMTVTASKSPAGIATPLLTPFIDDYEGPASSVGTPLGTVTSRDRFALCIPEHYPWGLDIRYRMLQPNELKQAQGFPPEYDIVGTKAERTEQIGNAVPVNLAKELCKHLLSTSDPDLSTYGGGASPDPEYEVPDYEEVISDD